MGNVEEQLFYKLTDLIDECLGVENSFEYSENYEDFIEKIIKKHFGKEE